MRALQRVLERRPDQAGFQQRRRRAGSTARTGRGETRRTPQPACSTWPNTYFDCSTSSRRRTSRVLHARRPLEVVDAVDALQHHRDPFEPVGQLRRDRRQLETAGLLEIGELRDLHAVEHHLPADAPGAERRRLPVVLLEADVVLSRVDAARLEAVQVQLLHFVGRRLEDHLELVVLEQAVRVLAEAAVGRPPRRLDVGDVPVRRAEHAQERLRVHRAGADLDVERLLQHAAARRPELRQLQDETLKRHACYPSHFP